MVKVWHWGLFLVLAALGALMQRVGALSFIHEAFHVAQAHSQNVALVSRTLSSATFERLTPEIIGAGYLGELWLYGGLAFVLGRWGSFFFGYGLMSATAAPSSFDFQVLLYDYAHRATGSSATADRAVSQLVSQFTTLALVVGLILLARYVHLLSRTERGVSTHQDAGEDRPQPE